MSYTSTRLRNRASRTTLGPRGRNLGDWTDQWAATWNSMFGSTGPTADQQCLASANAQSAQMLAKATDLSKNWNPPGLYSLEQMQSIVQSTMAMLLQSSNVIDKGAAEPIAPGARDALQLKRDAIQRKMATEGLVFTQAMGAAMNGNVSVIDAPGLKSWVVNSMIVAADGITAAYYVSCTTPWWVGALATFMKYFDKVWGAAKQVVGVAVQLGQQVLKIPDTLGQIWTIAKYGSIALLAWWAYENIPNHFKGA